MFLTSHFHLVTDVYFCSSRQVHSLSLSLQSHAGAGMPHRIRKADMLGVNQGRNYCLSTGLPRAERWCGRHGGSRDPRPKVIIPDSESFVDTEETLSSVLGAEDT